MLYAHYDRETGSSETLEEHLRIVSQEMEKGLETVSFSPAIFQEKQLSEIGLYHDIGKATKWFQEYLLTGHCSNRKKKNHSVLSAAIYWDYCRNTGKECPLPALISIACHHGDLSCEVPDEYSFDYLDEQFKNAMDILEHSELISWIKKMNNTETIGRKFRRYWKNELKKLVDEAAQSPELFFSLQFQFSRLISADKRDSAGLMTWGTGVPAGDIDAYIFRKSNGQKASVNDMRTEIRDQVLGTLRNLSDQEIQGKRIFTLTAPTGTGKTLTSLSAAMLLKDRLQKVYGIEPHIITVAPFLNILEQMRTDYENIFGEVLVDSSAVTVETDSAGEDVLSLQARQLLADSWMAPVVISTFVQFFESILSGENRKLLKFQRLANAIVIMDEIQALEAERYPLYSVVIDMLAKCLGTRFILMTATQPKMFDCTEVYQYQVQPRTELLVDYEQYFNRLSRTCLIPIMDKVKNFEQLCRFIEENVDSGKNILIVVNRIADSIELNDLLREYGYDTIYLSTNITGHDRKLRIQDAAARLKDPAADPFIMVSTQTIEAGVDLDFDAAFRDLAPMASIIQTAGRVNRSGNKGDNCPVYVFSTGSGEQIYNTLAVQKTAEVMGTDPVPEREYQKMVEKYYDLLICSQIFSFDQEKIYENGILPLGYSVISQFEMIRKQDRYSVIILQNEEACLLIQSLCELLILYEKSYEDKIRIQKLFCQIGQYSVDIFANKLKKNLPVPFSGYCEDICGRKIQLPYFVVPEEDLDRYYNETGFIAEEADMYLF